MNDELFFKRRTTYSSKNSWSLLRLKLAAAKNALTHSYSLAPVIKLSVVQLTEENANLSAAQSRARLYTHKHSDTGSDSMVV